MPSDLEILSSPDAPGVAPGDATAGAGEPAGAPADPAAAAEGAKPDADGLDWSPLDGDGAPAPAAEAPAAAAPAPAEDKPAEAAPPESVPEMAAPGARWGAPALTKMGADVPELGKLLAANPRVKAQLYQMARRSGDLAEFQDVLPTVSAAKAAREQAEALAEMDRLYAGDDPETFLTRLYEAQVAADPVTGERRSSGAYERMAQFMHRLFLDAAERDAAGAGDDELAGAIQVLRERFPWAAANSRGGADARGDRTLPADLRDRLARGEQAVRRLTELERASAGRQEEAREAWLDETAASVGKQVAEIPRRILAQSAFSEYEREALTRDFLDALEQAADADPAHQARIEEMIARGGLRPETRREIERMELEWAKLNGHAILRPLIARANQARKDADSRRAQVRDGYRAEPRGAGAAPAGAPDLTLAAITAKQKALGRPLTDREILDL